MKKTLIKSSVILLIMCGMFLTQAHANAQNATTDAEVEFTEGQGPTVPVLPDDPSVEANEVGVDGSFVIISVSDFYFGTIPISATTGLYAIETDKPNIQVVDLRGTGAGWKVSASVSRFSDGEYDSLPGASIHIKDGHPNSLSSSAAPRQEQDVELTTDGAQYPVITADKDAGTGLWVMRWYPSSEGIYIHLEIPAGSASLGGHMATINWTLENTP